MARSGPKLRAEVSVVRRLLQRWEGGQWTLMREQRPGDFNERGELIDSLQVLGPMRTVTVHTMERENS